MAASTLYTLLVKLGFDVSTLKAGSRDAQVELAAVGQAAKQAAANASPAAAALANMARAAQQVAGSSGATAVLRNMAAAADDVLRSTRGSANALNSFTASAQKVAAATGNGTVLNNYSKAVQAITTATGGSVKAITDFTKGVNRTLIETNGSVAGLNRYMTATVAAAQGAGSAAGAIRAVGMAARGGAPSLAEAAGVTEADAMATTALGNAAAAAAPKVASVGKAAQSTAGSLNTMSGAAMRGSQAIKEIGAPIDVITKRAGFLQRTLSMAFAFGGGVAVTTAIGFIGNALLGFNSRLQQAHIAFTTLLGDSGAADQFIKKMEDFANVTPFDFQGVEESTQRLLAMGFSAQQVLPTLRAVGDAVAGLGGSADKLDRVTIALGQMMTAGRVNSQDMRQLTEAGIPAWQFLADAIHKTVGETRKLAEDGLIPAAQAIPAILEGMDKKFGGLMAKQARTAQGAFSTIRDAALQTISGAIAPLFDFLTSGLVAIADFFVGGGGKYVVPMIHAIGIAIGVFLIPRIVDLVGKLEMVKLQFFGMTVPMLPLIAAIYLLGLAWQENFGGIRTTLGPVIKSVLDFAGAIVQAAANSGLLVPILTVLVSLIGVKFVAGLVASAAGMVANMLAAIALSGAMTGLTVTTDAATVATTGFAARAGMLVALLGGPLTAAIALFVAAGALLVMNFERIGQGVRVLEYLFVGAIKTIIDAAAMIPFVGDQFKGLSAGLQDVLNGISKDATEAEIRIQAAVAAANQKPDVAGLSDPKAFQDFINSFRNGAAGVLNETDKLIDKFGSSMKGVINAAKVAGADAMSEMAKAIRDRMNAPLDALKTLKDMMANAMSPTMEMARLIAELQSPEMQAAKGSPDASVRAQYEATFKYITDRLNELSGGAYTQGQAAGLAFTNGFKYVIDTTAHLDAAGKELYGPFVTTPEQAKAKWDALGPSVGLVALQTKKLHDELNKAAYDSGLSELNSAFDQIKSAAHRFFDEVHSNNLKLIDDALKHKNALLDAKEALNQAPVTAAQKALDFQRKAIEEWRLRQAVSHASTPEEYRDAVLALQDFLAQKHIDEMQAQVDTAKDVIEAQKKRNEDIAALQREAEDRRYQMESESFDRRLALLQAYLAKHPEEWQKTNSKVLALLASYGMDYKQSGALLGEYFVIGLREQIDAAMAAMAKMYGLDFAGIGQAIGDIANVIGGGMTPGSSVTGTSGGGTWSSGGGYGGVKAFDTGAWQIMKDNMLASLHKDEMVLPPDIGVLARQFASKSFSPSDAFQRLDVSGGGGGGTIIFQVGEEVLGEATDRGLQVQGSIYGNHRRVKVRSNR